LRDTIAKLLNDTDKITTFEQLDAFRKLVGNMMSSRGASEEFARVGFDAHLGSIYRALLADSEAVLASGGAQGAAQKATAAARNLFELDRASISNLLRDPDKAAQVVDRLTAKNTTPAQVRTFAQKIGAQPTSSGLPATAEGKAAWQQLSAEVMAKLRTEAINPNTTRQGAEVLSGQRLVSALQRMDGTGGVLREILGKQQADDLFKFGQFLRDASSAERMFANTSRTGQHVEALSYASAPQRGLTGILGAIGQYAGTKAVGRATMTPGGQKYLTQGVLQSPGAQTALGALGRLAPQMLALPYNNRQQGRR
jgi:hypothetical protein